MIVYSVLNGKVILEVEDPDTSAIIKFEPSQDKVEQKLFEQLKSDFEKGWLGIHATYQSLETTALDLSYAATSHDFFSYLNPVLIEGQEILDAFEYRDDVLY
jgi:hypothetical protein